jgi:hypothetical protein
MLKYVTALISLLWCLNGTAQNTYSMKGSVQDSADASPMYRASVLLKQSNRVVAGTETDLNGRFAFTAIPAGSYQIHIGFIGYRDAILSIQLDADKQLNTIKMYALPELLEDAEVLAKAIRVEISGDTTSYNAEAYTVNPDATAQDLLTKMPGVIVQNGKVQAEGEEVKRVLVDGKEFFTNDPSLALQTLPAEVVSKVQVFDDQSDQSKFTGFDDGNTVKTLNIITKTGKSDGQFGKVYGGYGIDDRYIAGGNMNFFNGAQRWSVLGLSNNVNVQNFSTSDIVGAIGSESQRGRRRGPPGGAGASSDANDFLVSSQGGISATQALGLNYIDEWGEKIKVSGSYFFNQSDNDNQQFVTQEYFTGSAAGLVYEEEALSSSTNLNHRFNMRMEYNIDSKNSILFRPSLSFQDYSGNSLTSAENLFSDDVQTLAQTTFNTALTGYTYGGDLLYRHRFNKARRTLSLRFNTSGNGTDGTNNLRAENYFSVGDSTAISDQVSDLNNFEQGYEVSVNYTEPIGKKSMLMVSYSPSITLTDADQRTNALDSLSDQYTDLQTALSSTFSSRYETQEAGLAFMSRGKETRFMLRLNAQMATLSADQALPQSSMVERNFFALLPFVMFRKAFDKKTNVRFFYRSRTIAPDFTELQTVVDNSNPLQLSTGDPNLDQQVSHRLAGRFKTSFKEGTQSFFAGFFGETRQDYIANATYIASQDSVLSSGYVLPQGSQLTSYENLDDYYSLRSFVNYGFPIGFLKSNLNLSADLSYVQVPGLVNGALNLSRTTSSGLGAVLGSNISEEVDFTLSYNGSYNQVNATLQDQLNNNCYQHTAGIKLNWLFGNGFVFTSDLNQTRYSGLDESLDQSFTLWNAGVGYKFMKGDRAEVKLSVFDILNQNNSISRTITETYIQDEQTTVLQQYFLLSFTYTFRNFGDAPVSNSTEDDRPDGPPPGRVSGDGPPRGRG